METPRPGVAPNLYFCLLKKDLFEENQISNRN